MADTDHSDGDDPRGGATAATAEPSPLNLANAFTFLRVLLVPVIGVLLARSTGDAGTVTRWWAFGIFVFAALTDSIDGWVARRLVGVTRWGQLADPLADKLLIIGSLAILAALGELPWWAVLVIIAREVFVTWQRGSLLRDHDVVMPASVWGKVKTVTQVIAVTLYLYPGVADVAFVALLVAVAATVGSGLEYLARVQRLRQEAVAAATGGS
ncbi:CDP-diacylglycerol--glycerol-3-phosphate 3-phosphatidyltransferase [Euzebya pacifica]|uniref:CDP-diacylglycerol--glycerol-3-phosphate 3-phosphatidyltransferase n=1 Tax=Euzebya pacifica TaxID=1608957 RepID=A0A346Y0K5_9ACTN|nr:CDP-diacylglycerol--glycerol-3-phosphate 3-phosphatidyltransferase [Euzebya pacifica]AXV08002.1 CDP-diacylglycerol--glycerol-3-phosphate 3-phosphatidyltransferase [Euzebya pacifica]